MAGLVDSGEITDLSGVDYNIHHLEVHYNTLNDNYQTAKLALQNNSSSSPLQFHALLNHLRSTTKTLFLMQRKLQLASTDLKQQLESVNEKIRNYKKEPEPPKHKKTPNVQIFTQTKPNLSFYFQYNGTRCEKDNVEYTQLVESGQLLLCHLPSPKYWREYDKQKLYDCVRRSVINQQSQKLVDKLDKAYELIKSTSNQKRLDILQQYCEDLIDKFDLLKASTLKDLLVRYPNSTFDWKSLSEQWSRPRFTEDECRSMWELVAHPSIVNEAWSKAEDLLLNGLASRYNFQNWDLICDKMNTGRTPFLCFIRHRSYFKAKVRKPAKVYSETENKLVNEFIDKKHKSQFDFANLLSHCGHITGEQLNSHLIHVSSSKSKTKGKFNTKEKYLIHFYSNRGHSCKKISQLLRTRTPKQIYDFQTNSRIPSVDLTGKWTCREVQKLLSAVKYNGPRRWSEISKYLKNRSAHSCSRKYRWLKSKCPQLVELSSKKSPNIKEIKTMLRDSQSIVSSRKLNSIDSKIEAYFVECLEKEQSPSGPVDATSLGKGVLDILKFLDLKVDQNTNQELITELGQWFLEFDQGDVNEPGSSKFDKLFGNLRASKKDVKMTKNTSSFTHIVPKKCPVLPPNKCTINGLNTFQKNLQSCCSDSNVDLSALWSKINTDNNRNKEFVEAKLLFYRILKGLFYWPLKLNSLPPDSFL